ncbi:MAG: hypothetical protein RL326_1634 [Pseudomonadota bacterium]
MTWSIRNVACVCLITASICVIGFSEVETSHGQSLRYMDSSGNLHFADSIKEVPKQYREQIYPPTPTPVLNRQQQLQKRMEEERIQRQKLQRERMKQMERDRRELNAERAARKKKNELRQDELSSGFQPGAF